MCRLSSEVFAVAGGGGALATAATFFKAHWDAIKDRRAFRAAKDRERRGEKPPSDVQGTSGSD